MTIEEDHGSRSRAAYAEANEARNESFPWTVRHLRHTSSDLDRRITGLVEVVDEFAKVLGYTLPEWQRKVIAEIQDIRGHIEHGPNGTCGVCAPDTDGFIVADFTASCGDDLCQRPINHGEEIIHVQGKWVHLDHN